MEQKTVSLWLNSEMRTLDLSKTSSACHQTCLMSCWTGWDQGSPRQYREPLVPGLKLSLALRHLASGNKYRPMQYAWRVPNNTISLVVREVCEAIIEECQDEVLSCPTTPDDWRLIADQFYRNFPNAWGALDGKHIAIRNPSDSGSIYYNYQGFYSVVLLALVDALVADIRIRRSYLQCLKTQSLYQ